MDLSNILSGFGGAGADPARMAQAVQEVFAQKGGVEGLLGTLRNGGLASQVDSWVSPQPNQAVEPQRLGAALGPDTVNQLSSKTGISIEALLPILAAVLPMIIDHLTPDGTEPTTGADGGLGQIGDLLGGILGGTR